MSGNLEGRKAVVTGAGSGMGEAIALTLARAGAHVIAVDIREAAARQVVEKVQQEGGRASSYRLDVSHEGEWETFERYLRAEHGGLHIMVGNAATFDYRKIEDTTLQQWTDLVRVNLDGVFLGTRTAIRVMKETALIGESLHAIVNMCSIGGIIGAPYASAYHMTKGGVRLFTKSVALECGAMNYPIRANTVHPGTTETPMGGQLFRQRAEMVGGTEESVRADMLKFYPLGRFGRPQDMADAVLFLAGPNSNYITGTELVVDGGFTAR